MSLSERIQRRRKDLGADVDTVAGWASLDGSRLREIESGSPMPPWEYEAICRALAVDSGVLARGRDRSPKRSVARFRKAASTEPSPDDLRTLALASEISRVGGFLASQLQRPARLADLREAHPVSEWEEPWKQGYRLGELARQALIPQPGPIHNLEGSLVDFGTHIARIPFTSPDLDAASLWEHEALPVILLNTASPRLDSALSRRALLAHELCHLLHDVGEGDLTTELTWGEGTGDWNTATEQRARAFAPAFLAPRSEVQHWFQADSGKRIRQPEAKVRELASRWGFSLRGAVWHAKNCEIIGARTANELDLRLQHEDHRWNDDFETDHTVLSQAPSLLEPGQQVSPVVSGLIAELTASAASAGVISEGRAREILTWS